MPRKIDKEFKINAVRLVIDQGLSVAKASEDLGVAKSALRRWVNEYKQSGQSAFPGKGYLRPEDEKMRSLEKENEKLKRERDILKKALAIFSSQ